MSSVAEIADTVGEVVGLMGQRLTALEDAVREDFRRCKRSTSSCQAKCGPVERPFPKTPRWTMKLTPASAAASVIVFI